MTPPRRDPHSWQSFSLSFLFIEKPKTPGYITPNRSSYPVLSYASCGAHKLEENRQQRALASDRLCLALLGRPLVIAATSSLRGISKLFVGLKVGVAQLIIFLRLCCWLLTRTIPR